MIELGFILLGLYLLMSMVTWMYALKKGGHGFLRSSLVALTCCPYFVMVLVFKAVRGIKNGLLVGGLLLGGMEREEFKKLLTSVLDESNGER